MTRITFGVAASYFAANMSVKQNALDHEHSYPLAFRAVMESFYVDDGLTETQYVDLAIQLREELQTLFGKGGFHLHKWNSNSPLVIQSIPAELRDSEEVLSISTQDHRYAKTLGIDWDAKSDTFLVHLSETPTDTCITKRQLLSGV
jgi:hypothetical protein